MTFAQSLIIYFAIPVIGVVIFTIFIQIVLSWLGGVGVIKLQHPMAVSLYHLLNRFVDPIVAPIRRFVPPFGGFDFSPLIAILLLSWVKGFVMIKLYYLLG